MQKNWNFNERLTEAEIMRDRRRRRHDSRFFHHLRRRLNRRTRVYLASHTNALRRLRINRVIGEQQAL